MFSGLLSGFYFFILKVIAGSYGLVEISTRIPISHIFLSRELAVEERL